MTICDWRNTSLIPQKYPVPSTDKDRYYINKEFPISSIKYLVSKRKNLIIYINDIDDISMPE